MISLPKFTKFVLLGAATWLFAFLQMYVYTQILSVAYALAYAITQLCIIAVNFTLARHWIFKSLAENPFVQAGRFVSAAFLFRFIDWCLFVVLNNFLGVRYYLSIFFAMLLVFPFKYLTYKIGVFHDREA